MIDHALAYLKRGWFIFPLRPRDKTPLTEHGVLDASNDEATVKAWWNRWPNANIGLACGASGLVVIDVDAKSGGVQSWAQLKTDHQLADTLTSRTGGGGFHLIYSDPKRKYRNSTSKIAQGIDTRAQNGYIVLPPSIHPSGKAYQWDNPNSTIESFPAELSSRLVKPAEKKNAPIYHAHADEIVQAAEALTRLNKSRRDDYQDWVNVGMSLHELGEAGRALWLDWSSRSPKFDETTCSKKWDTFNPSEMTLASLFYWANLDSPRERAAQHNGNGNGNGHDIQEMIFDASPTVPMPDPPPFDDTLLLEKPQDQKPQWQIKTLADAYAERPPLEFLIEGLFTLPSLSIVYGNSGSLKSMLLTDMAACVAGGIDWLTPTQGSENLSRQVKQAPVLWCDFDNGNRRTDERFDALGTAYRLSADLPLYYVSMPSPWLDISKNDSVMMFYDTCMALGAKFIIIDNLGVTIGGSDENSADMATVMGNARWLSEQMGAAIIFVHHQRKANGIAGHAGDDLRGHSSIKAALDLALLVEREDRSKSITIKSTKTRDIDVPPFGAMFEYEHKPGTTEMKWGRFFCEMVDDSNSDAAIERTVIEVLTDKPRQNQAQLTLAVKGILEAPGKNRIWSVVNQMVAEGKIIVSAGNKNAKIYDLP